MSCLSFHADRVVLKLHHHARVRLAIDVNTNIDGDLLALANNNEVQVFDDLTYWVALDVFDQHQVLVAGKLQINQCVGATRNQGCLVGGNRDV